MAISPNQCNGVAAMAQAEKEIDILLDSTWYDGCGGITYIGRDNLKLFFSLSPKNQEIVLNRYRQAGWTMSCEEGAHVLQVNSNDEKLSSGETQPFHFLNVE